MKVLVIIIRPFFQIIRILDDLFTWATTFWHPKEAIYGTCKKRGICCQNIAVGVSKQINESRFLMHIINTWYKITYNFKLKGWYPNDQILIYQCNYLKNGKCSIYWRRPLICRAYPQTKRVGQTTMPGCGFSVQPKEQL